MAVSFPNTTPSIINTCYIDGQEGAQELIISSPDGAEERLSLKTLDPKYLIEKYGAHAAYNRISLLSSTRKNRLTEFKLEYVASIVCIVVGILFSAMGNGESSVLAFSFSFGAALMGALKPPKRSEGEEEDTTLLKNVQTGYDNINKLSYLNIPNEKREDLITYKRTLQIGLLNRCVCGEIAPWGVHTEIDA